MTAAKPVVLDADVLINLIGMRKLDVLPKIRGHEFWITNHVQDEVHRKAQRIQIRKALKAGWVRELEVSNLTEIDFYTQYRLRFGKGESACLAVASVRGWIIATDDRAVQREVKSKFGEDRLLDTERLASKVLY